MDGIKRIRKEIKELRGSEEPDINLFPSEENIRQWSAFIKAPDETPFAGGKHTWHIASRSLSPNISSVLLCGCTGTDVCEGVYEIVIELGPQYPVVPPSMRFETKIFHPNVHFKDGTICLDILKKEWTPAWGLQSACRAVIALLSDPQADSPLNCDAGNMIRAGDMLAYTSMARMYKSEYALVQMPEKRL
jgi:peroxin-4